MNTHRIGPAARVAGAGLALGLMLAPGRAAAQSAACAIRLVRAPTDVAPLIDSRVAALGACAHKLDVWIVRTPDGLYLVAQDSLGRVRERVVPDAEVAAALIASWVENVEAILPSAPPDPAAPVENTPASRVTPPSSVARTADNAPVDRVDRDDGDEPNTDNARGRVDRHRGESEPSRSLRTFAVGANLGVTWDSDTVSGAHIEIELGRRSAWFTALDIAIVQEIANSYYVIDRAPVMSTFEEIGRNGIDGMVRVGVHVGGRVYLRPSLGVGVGGSRHEILRAEVGSPAGPLASTYNDWSFGPRLGVSLTAGIQFTRYALELNLAELASLQREKPGVSGDDRLLSAGVGLRFLR